jgi:hypothetical protein
MNPPKAWLLISVVERPDMYGNFSLVKNSQILICILIPLVMLDVGQPNLTLD